MTERASRMAVAPEAIQECPAYRKCREKGADCGICLQLDEDVWKEHVRAALSQE